MLGCHEWPQGTYGAPPIHADLHEIDGLCVGCKRLARLMHKVGLAGAHRSSGLVSLTRRLACRLGYTWHSIALSLLSLGVSLMPRRQRVLPRGM
ncbi:hypothetical protein GTY73_10680 [Streptomyces sp. SID8354]|nr:hypothetical protein [Streptomyces sp. SID8354]